MSGGAWTLLCLWSLFVMYVIDWKMKMRHAREQMKEVLMEIIPPAAEKYCEEYLRHRVKDFLVEIGNDGKYISLTWKEKE